ncbi:MAG: hypothetical protein LUD51_05110 [Clostridia bacterium]|nr:hypothetical protein [Clostridia bacterium]
MEITSGTDCCVGVECGINADVWDINGPHLENITFRKVKGGIACECLAQEKKVPLSVALILSGIETGTNGGFRTASIDYAAEHGAGDCVMKTFSDLIGIIL